MATIRFVQRVGGPLAPLNPASVQWTEEGPLVAIRHNGQVLAVHLTAEEADRIVSRAFARNGLPLGVHIGAGSRVGGIFSRVKRAATHATKTASHVLPTKVRKAAESAAADLHKAAKQSAVAVGKPALKAYSSPYTLAALSALSATGIAAPVTGPLAAGSAYAAMAQRGLDAAKQVSRGNYAGGLLSAGGAAASAFGAGDVAQGIAVAQPLHGANAQRLRARRG